MEIIKRIINVMYMERSYPYYLMFATVIVLGGGPSVYAQNTMTVEGTVTDANTGNTIPGVNILVKGTSTGASTDSEGNYELTVESLQDTLLVSFIGYAKKEVLINGRTEINIAMQSQAISGQEMVVVGYGTQSRKEVTTSVSKLDNQVLENVTYDNAASAMQGAVSGVRVQQTSGQPGATPRIIVRGGTSINNPDGATPLYVIDGVIRQDMDNIAAEDIESLQVLKDAAATAIYGARGSNGVVLINTKSGESGQTQISYSYDLSFSEPTKTYDLASASDYLHFARKAMIVRDVYPDASFRLLGPSGFGTGNDLSKNTAYTTQYLSSKNEHKLNEGWESMPDPIDPSKTLIFKGTDWQDVLFRTAVSHNHHLSVSGGTDKATFSGSLGYLDDQGIAITTDLSRYTLTLSGDFKVSDRLGFFGNTNYTRSTDQRVNNITNNFARGITLPPTAKYRFEDGTLAPGEKMSEGNPEYYLNKREVENDEENLTFTFGSQWDILSNLSFKPQISIYNRDNNSYNFLPEYLNGVGNVVDSRQASNSSSKWQQTQIDATLSYSEVFSNVHNIDALAGFSYFDRKISNSSATGQGASTNLIPTLNASAEPVNVSSSISDRILVGYFSRLNYNFDQRYLLSLNMRYDGASNLGANYKWGFFPGISIGWNLHQEKFWDTLPENLITVKLRGSYGVNGNIGNLGDFTAQGAYGVGAQYGNLAAIQNTVIPNPTLKWEQSKTLNFGTDIGLWNERINIIFDVYKRKTDNLITTLSLPPSTGFGSVLTNLGTLENKGVELELNADILPPSSKFQWNLGFNASWVKNRIMELPPNGAENNRIGGYYIWDPSIKDYNWLGGLQEGGTMGDYYEYKQLGIYATDEEAANAPFDRVARIGDVKHGGDVIWADLDGNGEIDDRDRAYVGNEFPDWTGGISSTFAYKNFMLSLRMDYALGHTIYNYARAFINGQWKLNMNLTQEMVENAWQEQGDETYMPRYTWESQRGAVNLFPTRTGQQYYESGDYLAIRELTVSYELPATVLDFADISSVRINITGNNLHYFTNYKGLNPEFGGQDYGRYPIPRSLILGVNISF